jgi:hypothetical protein
MREKVNFLNCVLYSSSLSLACPQCGHTSILPEHGVSSSLNYSPVRFLTFFSSKSNLSYGGYTSQVFSSDVADIQYLKIKCRILTG